MKPEKKHYVFGYDPGRKKGHGVAMLRVRKDGRVWRAEGLELRLLDTVADVIAEVKGILGKGGTIVASGIDTLTAWSRRRSGWRPADDRLRCSYEEVENSVVTPNGIQGSMCLNGAMVLRWLRRRGDEGGMITETHPKVCFFALWGRENRHPWAKPKKNDRRPAPADKDAAKYWLLDELDIAEPFDAEEFGDDDCDDKFDALLGCLAALRGLNREWTEDLHHPEHPDVIHPFGRTHYWWPEDVRKVPDE